MLESWVRGRRIPEFLAFVQLFNNKNPPSEPFECDDNILLSEGKNDLLSVLEFCELSS